MSIRDCILSGAAILALTTFACNESRPTGSATSQESKTIPAPETTVTNTNATIPSTTDVLANVTNRAHVTEPADEVKIVPVKQAKVIPGFTLRLRSAPWGAWIGSLDTSSGTVTEVARDPRGDYYLVLYPSAEDPSRQLAGWAFKGAVENTSWTAQDTTLAANGKTSAGKEAALACGKGETHMKTDHDSCAKACADDAACDASQGEVCDGLAFEERQGAAKMTAARFCVSAGRARTTN